MAKKQTAPLQPATPVIRDFGISLRVTDRSRKELDAWQQALIAAESVQQPTRWQLYTLYEAILLDEHLTSVMQQRTLAVTNVPLTYTVNGKPVDSVNALIETEGFQLLLEEIHNTAYFGYSLIRADFTATDVRGNPAPEVELVPRAWVIPTRRLVVTDPSLMDGIDYTRPPYPNQYLWAGRPHDLGLLLKAAPLVIMKRGNISDWADFNELFGQPLRKATYNPADPGQKAQLERALSESANTKSVVMPVGSSVEFVEASGAAASISTYEKFDKRENEALSKLIMLQTMTTESGSSLSQSEVHERLSSDLRRADRSHLLRLLNSGVKALLLAQGLLTGRATGGLFQFIDEEENISKADRLSMDLSIHTTVGPLPKAYFSEEYNVPFVDDTDTAPTPPPAPDPANPPDAKTDPSDPANEPTSGDSTNAGSVPFPMAHR